MSSFQYRIKVNDATGDIVDKLPGDRWSYVVQCAEDRGLYAALERQLITDASILPMLVDPSGYIKLGDIVICPWEILAEADFVGS